MLNARPTWILFDAVGTLLKAEPDVAAAYQQVGRRHGFNLSQQDIRLRISRAYTNHFCDEITSEDIEYRRWHDVVCEVFSTDQLRGRPIFEELWQHFAMSQHWRLFNDVPHTWYELVAQGFQLGIASNFDERLFSILREITPLQQTRQVFTSSRVGYRKPCIDFFRFVESELGCCSHELLLVGDNRIADYEGAAAAGWQKLLINRALSDDTPSVIHRLTSLPDMLAG